MCSCSIFCLVCNVCNICAHSEAQFRRTVDVLTETFTGQKNTAAWHGAFDIYCNPKLKLMFISHFERFIKENSRIMWALDEIQVWLITFENSDML